MGSCARRAPYWSILLVLAAVLADSCSRCNPEDLCEGRSTAGVGWLALGCIGGVRACIEVLALGVVYVGFLWSLSFLSLFAFEQFEGALDVIEVVVGVVVLCSEGHVA